MRAARLSTTDSSTTSTPEYFFDWRHEAGRDGWQLDGGLWTNRQTDEQHPDESYVYLGSGCWVEAWPTGQGPGARETDRSVHRERDTAW